MRHDCDTVIFGDDAFSAEVKAALAGNGCATANAAIGSADSGATLQRQLLHATRIIVTTADSDNASKALTLLSAHPAPHQQQRIALGPSRLSPIDGLAAGGLRYVSLPRIAARTLLNQWPLHFTVDVAAGHNPQLLILGFNSYTRALLAQAMALGHYGNGALHIRLHCSNPDTAAHWFELAYPQAGQFCDVRFGGDSDWQALDASAVSAAYVCRANDADTLASSRRLAAWLDAGGHPASAVFVLLQHSQHGDAAAIGDWDGRRYPFVTVDQVCRTEVLFGEARDTLARIIHEHYQDTIASQSRDPANTPAAVPWHSLDESYRDASRQQSDHVAAKLALAQCSRCRDQQAATFAFSNSQVEQLAQIEHLRWAADRYLAGWRWAEQRDNDQRLHPDLVPFEALSQPTRDLDRFAVRLLPALIGREQHSIKPQLRILLCLDAATLSKASAQRLACALMDRLEARYQAEQPVLLCRIDGRAEDRVVKSLVFDYGLPLWALFAPPSPTSPTSQTAPTHKRPASELKLLAQASARLPFPADTGGAWARQRCDIVCADDDGLRRLFGASDAKTDGSADKDACHPRIAAIDSARGHIDWRFAY